ncbi:MAG: hypothetical protein AAGC44_08295 [Planctomycetota bacterium]
MSSIANIPEPTTAYRPNEPEPAVSYAPIGMRPTLESGSGKDSRVTEEQSIASWLMVMIGGGLLLRIGLLYFGAWREVLPGTVEPWTSLGQAVTKDPAASQTAWPVFAVLASLTQLVGLPAWFLVMLGAMVTTAAIPAAYTLGRHITGSVAAGLGAAAIVAFHPAVHSASGVYSPVAFTLGLTTIGLALVAMSTQRGQAAAWAGAGLIGVASLTAPLAWAMIPLAAVLAGQTQSRREGLVRASMVLAISIIPAVGWYSLTQQQPLTPPTSLSAWPAMGSVPAGTETAQAPLVGQIVYASGNHSLPQLGQALHAEIVGVGPLTQALNPGLEPPDQPDPVASTFGDAWVVFNLALLLAAAASVAILTMRGRALVALGLVLPLFVLLFTGPLLGEPGRTGLLGVHAVLAMGFLAVRPAARYTVEEQAALEAERLAKQEARQQAKLARIEEKQLAKGDIYAFDRQERQRPADRRSDPSRAGTADRRHDPQAMQITTQRTVEEPTPVGRPI